MTHHPARRIVAASVVVALIAMYAPAFAAPATATVTGTVFGDSLDKPLAGVTVVVTDAAGATISSRPTTRDGAFTVAGLAPGRQQLTIQTGDGDFGVATPVTLAPGETRGVHLALRGKSGDDDDKKKKKGAAGWTAGAKASMIAVLVGFVAAGAVGINQAGNDSKPPASPSAPPDK